MGVLKFNKAYLSLEKRYPKFVGQFVQREIPSHVQYVLRIFNTIYNEKKIKRNNGEQKRKDERILCKEKKKEKEKKRSKKNIKRWQKRITRKDRKKEKRC